MKISNSVIIHTSFRFKQNELKLSLSSVLCTVTRVNCIALIGDPRTVFGVLKSKIRNVRYTYTTIRSVNPYSRDIFRRFYSFYNLFFLNRLLVWHTEPHHKKIVNPVLNTHRKLIVTSYPYSSYSHEIIFQWNNCQILHFSAGYN